jgi:tRNA threonylcarbamoyladenosine biosynthesis protein TsaE
MNTNLTFTRITHHPDQTEQLGEQLGALLSAGDLVCLSGDLGAGKTCLTRGLARGWGALQHPTSPTFTLINEYTRRHDARRFYHVDCYRLEGTADARTTGLDDLFDGDGVIVIEWPERIQGILPPDRLWVQLNDRGGNDRELIVTASGDRSTDLLRKLKGDL